MKRYENGFASPARGFSLLEIMLVVVIIGLLMGTAAIAIASRGDSARQKNTVQRLLMVEGALDGYYTDYGSYPATLDVLRPDYLKRDLKDAWDNEMVYFTQSGGGQPFVLFSMGKDGESDTDDDIYPEDAE